MSNTKPVKTFRIDTSSISLTTPEPGSEPFGMDLPPMDIESNMRAREEQINAWTTLGTENDSSSWNAEPGTEDNLATRPVHRAGLSEPTRPTRPVQTETEKTVPFRPAEKAELPVLGPAHWVQGWLVAISGPMKGRSFPISYGNNVVGSSEDCDVYLDGDKSVSRSQLIISYDEETKETTIDRSDDASQPSRLIRKGSERGSVLLGPTVIEHGDIIRLSQSTSLRYIPMCGEDFDWDYTAPSQYGTPVSSSIPLRNLVSVRYYGDTSRPTMTVNRKNDSPHTVLFRPEAEVEPEQLKLEECVQGWLVAVTGPMQGRFFPISYGFNHVGRSPKCRVCLSEDPGVSGTQIIVLYDEVENETIVSSHKESSVVTRLVSADGKRRRVESSSSLLSYGDLLVMSQETTLRYVPFCDDAFCWDYPTK